MSINTPAVELDDTHAPTINIFINDTNHKVTERTMTGAQIAELGAVPEGNQIWVPPSSWIRSFWRPSALTGAGLAGPHASGAGSLWPAAPSARAPPTSLFNKFRSFHRTRGGNGA